MRLEYKYLVSNNRLETLRDRILPYMDYDKYAQMRPEKEYVVRSIYFDSPNFDFYYEKLAGLQMRKKVRIRGYNELHARSLLFLEIKRKYESFISKNRATVLVNHAKELFQTGNIEKYVRTKHSLDGSIEDAKKFFYYLYHDSLKPVILILYNREAFWGKFNKNLRITFDKQLRSEPWVSIDDLFTDRYLKPAMRSHFIFEVKFYGGVPNWLMDIIKELNAQRLALSKYTICLDSHKLVNRYNEARITFLDSFLTSNGHYAEDCRKDVAGFSEFSHNKHNH
jgi:hypothetical protein